MVQCSHLKYCAFFSLLPYTSFCAACFFVFVIVILSFVFVNICCVFFFVFCICEYMLWFFQLFIAYSLPELTTGVCRRLILFSTVTWSICWLTLKEAYIYLHCFQCVIKDNDCIQMEVHSLYIML